MATLNTYQNAVVDRYKAADGTTDYEKAWSYLDRIMGRELGKAGGLLTFNAVLIAVAIAIGFGLMGAGSSFAASITLYGGNGGLNNGTSLNDGSLVLVDQTTGGTSLVGHVEPADRLPGDRPHRLAGHVAGRRLRHRVGDRDPDPRRAALGLTAASSRGS